MDGMYISVAIWKDNKTVTLLPAAAGQVPVHQVEGYDKKRVTVDCPEMWAVLICRTVLCI